MLVTKKSVFRGTSSCIGGSRLPWTLFAFVSICIISHLVEAYKEEGPIKYTNNMSQLRIDELKNIGALMNNSVNHEKYACDNYYEYVCSRNQPLFSVMGNLLDVNELIMLLTELQNDPHQFEAKQKLMDFFISCNTLKSLEDCYRESFEYFKPLFGYIITKNFIDSSSHEHQDFLQVLQRFLLMAENTDNFRDHPIRLKLAMLKENFRHPHLHFRSNQLNEEYRALRIYRESYQHNVKNLDEFLRRNSTFQLGTNRNMLDWTMFVFQSRNKPMSYYFPTLSVHLWMTLYNTTVRQLEPKDWLSITDCLHLPQYVNVLEEARVLAVVYLKSFKNAWDDYNVYKNSTTVKDDIFKQENQILSKYNLDNYRLFFTLYGQNFCYFGKELAEHIFYLGLKNNKEFYKAYGCGQPTETHCV